MERHSDNKKWKQWNLESTAKILEKRFPNSFVWVVRPSRYHLNTFACYQNFVETNMFGVPDHRNPEYGALKHLRALLEAAVRKSKCDHRELRLTIASSKPNYKNWSGNLWFLFSRCGETKTSKLAIMTLLGQETVTKQQREIFFCGMYFLMACILIVLWILRKIPYNSLLETLRSDDGNGNATKAIGLISKTTILHVHHAFFYISLPSLHDYDVKMPNFTMCRGSTQATTRFPLSF